MIDKSVAYKDIIMVMPGNKATDTPEPTLPQGFSFRFFNDENDISHWCRIETSVQEFDSEAEALDHFKEEFYPHMEELKKRCIFVLNKEGLPIATAMGWFSHGEIANRLHWIAVCPGYQGLGLGKSVSQKAVTVCAKIAPGEDIWLSTQTWSHRAVLMYHKLGFDMLKSEMQLGEKNAYVKDFDDGMEILASILKPADVAALQESTR